MNKHITYIREDHDSQLNPVTGEMEKHNRPTSRIYSEDEEKLLLEPKDIAMIPHKIRMATVKPWEAPSSSVNGADPHLKRITEINFNISDLDSRSSTFESDPIMERRVYVATKTGRVASNHNLSSRSPRPKPAAPVLPPLQTWGPTSHRRVLEIEHREQGSLGHRRPSRERVTNPPDALWGEQNIAGSVFRRKHIRRETTDWMYNSPLKRTRQRPVKDRLGQVRHRGSSEQSYPHIPRSRNTSLTTHQRSQKSTQGHPATGANAIKLLPAPFRRHFAVRTPQQLNRALLQLAGYENEGRKWAS